MENTKALAKLSTNAQKFCSDLFKKKKSQIEKGNYVISVYFETLQGQDDSTGKYFDFTEAVVRGMIKRKSGYVTDVSKRFDYEGKDFKNNEHVIVYGKGAKAVDRKSWTAPEVIAENNAMKELIEEIIKTRLSK